MSRRRKNALLQRFEYLLYRGVAGIAASFSEERARRWGTRLGNIARRVLRGRDRLAMRNLAAAFPERSSTERRRILDECWRHFGREMLSYLRVQRLDPAAIPALCRASGTDLLDEAIAHGRGVMMISAHFGSWEIGGLAIMALVDNVRTVARPLDNELLERDLARIRARTGAQVLDRRRAARPLFKTLSENGAVVLLVDQAVIPREGVLVPFLGRPAWTTDAPAKLALRLGSRIVIAFCIPDSTGHRLEFEELIRLEELGNDERTPEALTTRINDVISRRIAARPELWLWMHDRWKGSVTGESENKTPDAE